MKRLTVTTVLKNYKSTGCIPIRGHWENDTGCCPFAALAMAKGIPLPEGEKIGDDVFISAADVASTLGYDPEYVHQFTIGFDTGRIKKNSLTKTEATGRSDGVAASKAVFHKS